MVVSVQRHGDVAVIAMDNPPVNALGIALRTGLMDALTQLRGETGLRAIVLAGTARAFSGGADITEFGKPPQEPNLRVVIAAIEDMPVPVVAAIQGVALGGGLELALGCHARVAWASARLGLPEVKLGLLPGAGGTQRLPRVVGVEKALAMIVSGNPVGGKEAAEIGLVDALLEGDYPQAAVDLGRGVTERRRVRDREEKLQPARDDAGLIDRLAAPLLKASGARRPRACVEAVRNAVTMPFDDGLKAERQLFEKLVAGDESRAQRHAFFAEREAQKAKLPEGTKARKIERAAVIGAGTMGGGIAMCFANAGIPVTVIEMEQARSGPRPRPGRRAVSKARPSAAASPRSRPKSAAAASKAPSTSTRSPTPTSSSRPCSRRWRSRNPSSGSSTGSPSPAPSSPPTPATSTSTRSPPPPAGPATCSACTSSARPTSCACSRSSAGERPAPR